MAHNSKNQKEKLPDPLDNCSLLMVRCPTSGMINLAQGTHHNRDEKILKKTNDGRAIEKMTEEETEQKYILDSIVKVIYRESQSIINTNNSLCVFNHIYIDAACSECIHSYP